MQGNGFTTTALIANGTSLSPAIDFASARLVRIRIPGTWTTANLTFQSSDDEGLSWNNVYDANGNEYTVTVPAASIVIILNPTDFVSFRRLKIRSGTNGTPVTQAQDSLLALVAYPW